jgi:alpha-L-rhamnosidase
MRKILVWCAVVLAGCSALPGCRAKVKGDLAADVQKLFADPPAEYRSTPLWVWNDRITKEEIDTQLADFQAHGIGGVFIHPRPGLITPYLSEEWFELCRHAVETGRGLGMKVWIYDENSYPSGFAGGHVPAEMPDSIGLGLRLTKASGIPASFPENPQAVLRKSASGFEDVTGQALEPGGPAALGPGEYYIFEIQKAAPSPWFGGFTYVDLMRSDVTARFLTVTLDAYKSAVGGDFGRTVPGSFQDEAHIAPVSGKDIVNFTPGLFDRFQKKWGYDLRPQLPSLYEETGDWRTVRHNFYATTLELFIEGWAKPYSEYCAANNLWFTGHYFEHEWPRPNMTPDYLAMPAYSHMPGIDVLMNQWATGPHDQFGNARPPKEIRSVANQLGRTRTMSETYGAGGWDLRFFDQKRIADWEFALGVNFINQHLSYVTIMGARKRDHPQSFSYHEPWWPAYKVMGDYLGRLSVAMSLGRQVSRVLVLEPSTTGWMYYTPVAESERLAAIGRRFTDFINQLEANHVEYDLASEDILRNHARVDSKQLVLGERRYDVIVVAPGTENLNASTVDLLSQQVAAGGRVLSVVEVPAFVDGKGSDAVTNLAKGYSENWLQLPEADGLTELGRLTARDIEFADLDGDLSTFFHHRRLLADGQLVFLANISPDRPMTGRFAAEGRSVEVWNPFTGTASAYACDVQKGRASVQFGLPPGGSALFCLRQAKGQAVSQPGCDWVEVPAESAVEVQPASANVLTIDYCDLRLDGRVEKDLYFYDAQKKTFEHHGLKANPWDSAVQYKTNILDLNKFPPDSGFEAAFWFEAAPGVDFDSLRLVVERPVLYLVSVNGTKVEPLANEWWLDKAFGVFEIGRLARPGRNRIAIESRPFTIFSELEAVYVLGNFGLESQAKGFRLVPQKPFSLGPWKEQARPFYAGGVSYIKNYAIAPQGSGKGRYLVKLGDWLGSVAEVRVGEKSAGFLAFAPFELEITDLLNAGSNTVSVTVMGTLKNTLGPHHNNPVLGTAWPGMFQKGATGGYPPGSEYSFVGYGLFDDFKVLQTTGK